MRICQRPGWLRPGPVAVGLSLLVHAGILAAALFLPARPSESQSRPAGIDAWLLAEEPETAAADPELPTPSDGGEERSEDFHFADSGPEPAGSPEPAAPATLTAPDGEPQPGGGAGSVGTGGRPGGAGDLFRAAGGSRSIVYVIDRSLSMGLHGTLDTAKRELLASLERLPSSAHFQVIFYNREAHPLPLGSSDALLPASDAVRRAVAEIVAEVPAEGGTDHVAALRLALTLRPEVICLVTDADDMTAEQVRDVTRINHGRAAIHAVDLGMTRGPTPDGALRTLTRLNRATYRAVTAAELR